MGEILDQDVSSLLKQIANAESNGRTEIAGLLRRELVGALVKASEKLEVRGSGTPFLTALRYAEAKGHDGIAKLLRDQLSALQYAQEKGYDEVAQLLRNQLARGESGATGTTVDAKADAPTPTDQGKSAGPDEQPRPLGKLKGAAPHSSPKL